MMPALFCHGHERRRDTTAPHQSISGHKTLSALERYLDVTDEEKLEAIAKLNFFRSRIQ
jgi:flavoprotein